LEASKITRDLQPMQWQFIETPTDGMLILEWQPLEYLGTNYASDGFIWADQEHVYKSEVRGYVGGFIPGATHTNCGRTDSGDVPSKSRLSSSR
jgi:hypothetical protein